MKYWITTESSSQKKKKKKKHNVISTLHYFLFLLQNADCKVRPTMKKKIKNTHTSALVDPGTKYALAWVKTPTDSGLGMNNTLKSQPEK